jgi:hypothetical protein
MDGSTFSESKQGHYFWTENMVMSLIKLGILSMVPDLVYKFHIYNTWSFIDKKRYITQLNRHLIVSIDEKEQLILVWFNIPSLSKYPLLSYDFFTTHLIWKYRHFSIEWA